ncbi:hypothetical protein COY87_00375 [Candidatus Roizmanbacteria bacterium CG_4_10_14_0_8_um_filter_33_9]|uniref:Uncharacterized protein n=1 Tax=Candidatus Roizmanbacteria bacterium CG_4_10_14_0_8_um_filter_33_9 TaxID=1974826 RepID=A0A2M7QL17_9BACT|nr:MAG: hypothetical protein COY87_00375 [Candidatus Roizmanbacteria bacterium CG_4_10_14_0_8_um_filter_33_9]
MKTDIKEQAIQLRKKGFSYNKIRENISVSKSSLSLWLRSVDLTKRQKQKLTHKKMNSLKRGWKIWHETRMHKIQVIKKQAFQEVKDIKPTKPSLFLMGLMLYWAEGSKEKNHRKGSSVIFSNSDPKMIQLFLKWLYKCNKITQDDFFIQLYLHQSHKDRLSEIISFWSKNTQLSHNKFDRIYFKKHNFNTLRKKTGNSYFGLLRIVVRKSTDFNRKISGWIEGICNIWGIV